VTLEPAEPSSRLPVISACGTAAAWQLSSAGGAGGLVAVQDRGPGHRPGHGLIAGRGLGEAASCLGPAPPDHVTEVRLLLRRTPRLSFLPLPTRAGPKQIVLRIDPDPGVRLELSALASESWHTVHLDASFTRKLGEPAGPYERLLQAALAGDHQLSARQDGVEET